MNKAGEENRSVRNTKRRLRDGLLQLLDRKPINEISVKELTDLVDVNRGTFYFHYQDILTCCTVSKPIFLISSICVSVSTRRLFQMQSCSLI